MIIADLKELIAGLPDDMEVFCPMNPMEGFTGAFYSPCLVESGKIVMGTEELSDEEIAEYELLERPLPGEDTFVLVPCGFYEEHEGVDPALN